MSKYSLDYGWKFHEGEVVQANINTHTKSYMAAKAGGALHKDFDKSMWEDVNLPHDFAVAHEFDESCGPANSYKARGTAWYSKRFKLDEADRDKQILIEFEGVTGECTVWLNGSVIGRNFSGYNSFVMDATQLAFYGERINELVVYVNANLAEGWWYEGAGIYRHVNLYKKNLLHFEHNGIFVEPKKTENCWKVLVHATVENSGDEEKLYRAEIRLYDVEGNVVGQSEGNGVAAPADVARCEMEFEVENPVLWDVENPYLYRVEAKLYEDVTMTSDAEEINIGFRTIAIDAERGFYLNGRNLKILGTCNHQDHAGVGVAVPDSVHEYRIKLLKEMGSNAYRSAHGNAPKAVLEACDKYGMLVMDEARQFNTAEFDGLKQLRDMVKRDRNHPSVIMYSMFNEEPFQGSLTGQRLTRRMVQEVRKYDTTRFTTGAMNGGLFDKDGAVEVCDITGINYQSPHLDRFREQYPHRPVIGTENCSAFMTRGCYETDYEKHVIAMDDETAAPWGDTYRDGFEQLRKRPYFMGYFVWTGFDYRGEPTPFAYPAISTQFGIMDTCGFRKSAYYLNKSFWTTEPVVHIVSHWNYARGEMVNIRVFSNCSRLELYVNGKVQGKATVDERNTAIFRDIAFEAGELKVIATDCSCEDKVYTCGKTAALSLEAGMDIAYVGDGICVNVTAVDENGYYVYNADEKVKFSVEGGWVLGVGNGNPLSHEADVAHERKLFAGHAQVVILPEREGELIVEATTEEGIIGRIVLEAQKVSNEVPVIPSVSERYLTQWRKMLELSIERPDPMVEIADSDMNTWVLANVGEGPDELFQGACGYQLYRTETVAHAGEALTLNRVIGNHVEIYINEERILDADCMWGKEVRYLFKEEGPVQITVLIYCDKEEQEGGITKQVFISK